jgi:hypothetical protein
MAHHFFLAEKSSSLSCKTQPIIFAGKKKGTNNTNIKYKQDPVECNLHILILSE